jgi:excisionase family DNA binding protein
MPDQINTTQAMSMLSVTRPTVIALIHRGEIRAARIGKQFILNASDVRALVGPIGAAKKGGGQ